VSFPFPFDNSVLVLIFLSLMYVVFFDIFGGNVVYYIFVLVLYVVFFDMLSSNDEG
jgi:hypothetical protein